MVACLILKETVQRDECFHLEGLNDGFVHRLSSGFDVDVSKR